MSFYTCFYCKNATRKKRDFCKVQMLFHTLLETKENAQKVIQIYFQQASILQCTSNIYELPSINSLIMFELSC